MPKIHQLDPVLINQIAAGEVIERPASVVKELVENALDAGATKVEILLKKAGRELIVVKDNGCGMSEEDAKLSLQRHATSKIKSFEDLTTVASMGFRGEAVPSIASISHLRLLTRTPESTEGFQIKVEGGKLTDESPAAADFGTQITIEHLFFNVPARRKFLKSDSTELGHTISLIKALALANNTVGFSLKHAGKSVIELPANQSLKQRAGELFENTDGLLEVQAYEERSQLTGLISAPSHRLPSRNGIYFFVNGRCIDNKLFNFALKDAYGESMGPGHYPMALLFLELPAEQIDVNVHPAKREIRFRNQSSITSFLRKALARTLDGPRQRFSTTPQPSSFEDNLITPEDSSLPRLRTDTPDYNPFTPTISPFENAPEHSTGTDGGISLAQAPSLSSQTKLFVAESAQAPAMRFLSFLKKDFALFENDEGLVILNISAVQERVAYAQMLKGLQSGGSQALLTPALLNLDSALEEALEHSRERLESLGFTISEFGGEGTYRLEAIPAWLSSENGFHGQSEDFVLEELATLAETEHASSSLSDEAIVNTAARFAHQSLSHPSAAAYLLEQLLKTPQPLKAPSGKPTIWQISQEELAKRFA